MTEKDERTFSLPCTTGCAVILVFGLVILGFFLWKPLKIRYYASKLRSDDIKVRQHAAKILLDFMTERPSDQGTNRPVFDYYTERYSSKDVKERVAVVDELCEIGDKGQELMKEIFRNRCYAEQVKIPAGKLKLSNGTEVKMPSLWVDKYEVTNEKYCVFAQITRFITEEPIIIEGKLFQAKNRYWLEWYFRPIIEISWQEARAYTEWLGMRLPADYEWEYATRAGWTGKYRFNSSENKLDEYAWYKRNSSDEPHPVGRKNPNDWGLYDIFGNVSEWSAELDEFTACVMGGSFKSSAGGIKSRMPLRKKKNSSNDTGFRCVRDAK